MKDVKGIDQMFQAGTYVAFTLEKGAKPPTKDFFEKGFKGQKMKLVSFEKEARKRPLKAFELGIKPVT